MHGNFGSKGQVIQFLSRSLDSIVQVASPQGLFDYPKSHRAVSSAGWGPALARFGHCHSTTWLSWKLSLWAWKSKTSLDHATLQTGCESKLRNSSSKEQKRPTQPIKQKPLANTCHATKPGGDSYVLEMHAIITWQTEYHATVWDDASNIVQGWKNCESVSKLQPSVLNSCTKPNLSWHFETVYISTSLVTEKVVSMHEAAQYAWSAP